MPSTIVADRLEYVLVELHDAIAGIESRYGQLGAAPDALNEALLAALKKARDVLEEAQEIAEKKGVPRLRVFGA
jgi:prefoldin subunit 5